ncbi:MAG: 3-oxoacyl-[acyl-carrier-protein] reductase [Alphaproteobacteria bacterium]|jgi:3-oxoacyl-[acyl-carrier protein] reductase|nr:3-oxoacyl-[acyl-carrier-protein] reductase [Alphaproteobacteria bacterium]
MLFNLSGKTVLITGAGGGIGKAIARAMHAQGAIIGLSDVKEEFLKDIAAELGDRVHILPSVDITDEANVNTLAEKAEEIMGKVDILVNNAGITRDTLSIRMPKKDWDDVIAINLTTPFLLSKAILSKMMKRKYGRVINIASVVGVMGNAGQANYSASKGGLIAMTKTLAREFANRGITVNAVAPGFITTKMTEILPEDQKQKLLSAVPLNRMGSADEVAYAVTFLATDEAGYITGQTININGGMVMV